ncbi:MAG: Hsp20/alpha crystallin family protein [Bacillota bacterium]
MSLVEWNPFRDIDFFNRDNFRFFNAGAPRVDVYQTDKDVVVKAEIPGVVKDDLDVYVDENSVRLSGQAKRNEEFKDEHVYRTERYYGGFSRTIPLPAQVKPDQAKAKYKDGILDIIAPKAETAAAKGKKIEIQ